MLESTTAHLHESAKHESPKRCCGRRSASMTPSAVKSEGRLGLSTKGVDNQRRLGLAGKALEGLRSDARGCQEERWRACDTTLGALAKIGRWLRVSDAVRHTCAMPTSLQQPDIVYALVRVLGCQESDLAMETMLLHEPIQRRPLYAGEARRL